MTNKYDLLTLLSYAPENRRKEVADYAEELVNTEGYDIDYEFMGFISDYINYADILKRKADIHNVSLYKNHKPLPPLTVYDIGCSHALQHLVFDHRIHYVGVDPRKSEPRFFRENCKYVSGRFSAVASSLEVDKRTAIGIANMSLLYTGTQEELELFDKMFRTKFIL